MSIFNTYTLKCNIYLKLGISLFASSALALQRALGLKVSAIRSDNYRTPCRIACDKLAYNNMSSLFLVILWRVGCVYFELKKENPDQRPGWGSATKRIRSSAAL